MLRFVILALIIYFIVRASGRAMRPAPAPQPPRPARRSPYEVLGVTPGASFDDVREAYQRLVRQHHPDRVADMADEIRTLAEERTKEINAAYEELKRKERV